MLPLVITANLSLTKGTSVEITVMTMNEITIDKKSYRIIEPFTKKLDVRQ